ncbi:MAG: hypothetical protein JXR54_11050 [Tannerellaceae bacterium]|nr:hypothetical protein [Tannerellaceae bacterium]
MSGQSWQTTYLSNEQLDWIEITHPFHPLYGKRFQLLKTRHIGGQDIFSVKYSGPGTLAIPRDWTDRANPSIYADLEINAPVHSHINLLALAALIELLNKNDGKNI